MGDKRHNTLSQKGRYASSASIAGTRYICCSYSNAGRLFWRSYYPALVHRYKPLSQLSYRHMGPPQSPYNLWQYLTKRFAILKQREDVSNSFSRNGLMHDGGWVQGDVCACMWHVSTDIPSHDHFPTIWSSQRQAAAAFCKPKCTQQNCFWEWPLNILKYLRN